MTLVGLLLLFLSSVLVYSWCIFPLILLRRSRHCATRLSPPVPGPSVAVVLAAYNEQKHLRQRIENLLAQAVDGCTYAIHVGLDGSTDDSAKIVGALAAGDSRVVLHDFPQRRGKAAVLKDLVLALGRRDVPPDILVFTDANTVFGEGAIERLLAHFGDSRIGGVCGRLVLRQAADASSALPSGESAENVYWRWETELKGRESDLDSCLGANGAIYALRRDLFWQDLPDNTVVDDFVIGMKVRELGFRMVYEPAAVAEEPLPSTRHEWTRRVRIGAGDFQALALCRACLSPTYGRFAWLFWSHKVLRWFTPHICLLLLVVSVAAVLGSDRVAGAAGMWWVLGVLPAAICVLFLLGLGCAMAGRLAGRVAGLRGRAWRLLRAWDYFVTLQAAVFVGSLRFCRGNLKGHWARTPR